MTIELKNKARDIIEQMNKQGMRVIAVAHKSYLDKTCDFRIEDEKDMVLIGYLAFLDPPKQSAASAIKHCMNTALKSRFCLATMMRLFAPSPAKWVSAPTMP